MAASTPGGGLEVANEGELRAKLSEELGDAIGFLEVHKIISLMIARGKGSFLSISGGMVRLRL